MNTLNRLYLLDIFVYFISIVFVCYFSIQKQFISILIPVGLAFVAFFILLKLIQKEDKLKEVLILIFLLKITILFSFPHLSDDIYRFWWDGILGCNGYSPYEYSPKEFMNLIPPVKIHELLQKNYYLLNSADYHTVYPLVCQWIFRLCASMSGDNIFVFNLLLKVIFLIADSCVLLFLFKLLNRFQLSKRNAILFFGNPFCIIELNANLHFEIFLILFLVLSIYYFEKRQFIYSGLQLGLSIVSKLVSLLWFPLFIKSTFWNKKNFLFSIGLFIPICLFLVTMLPSIDSYKNSLGLYFSKFEFNSFIYGPLFAFSDNHKWYLFESKISLVLMSLFCLIYLIIISKEWIRNQHGFSFKSAWLILFAYLLLNTTVHPWYLTPLILLSVFSFQFTGMAWSFLIFLSYARYDTLFKPYESYLILLEYIVVILFFIRDWRILKYSESEPA